MEYSVQSVSDRCCPCRIERFSGLAITNSLMTCLCYRANFSAVVINFTTLRDDFVTIALLHSVLSTMLFQRCYINQASSLPFLQIMIGKSASSPSPAIYRQCQNTTSRLWHFFELKERQKMMNLPTGRRIASLQDFIRKPRSRARSKLSQVVQINEVECGSTDEDVGALSAHHCPT